MLNWLSAPRHLFDWTMHGHRVVATGRRLSNARRPERILVVCEANLCRSPYLERRLREMLGGVEVISAGFVGSDRPVPALVIEAGGRRGIDLSTHRSRPITQSKIHAADLVLVMDADQARRLATHYHVTRAGILIAGDVDPRWHATRGIQDPVGQRVEVIDAAFHRLDRCAVLLQNILRRPNLA
jgi:protein-tyrosine phosphatase